MSLFVEQAFAGHVVHLKPYTVGVLKQDTVVAGRPGPLLGGMHNGGLQAQKQLVELIHILTRAGSETNMVKARAGLVLAVATEGDADIADRADDVIYIPAASAMLTPILMAVPMQLLAYHIAVRRGCDVDQPRNLAKSVTVE